jgi:hypothetical protein
MEQAKSALVGGLNQLEFKVLKAQNVKPQMAIMIIQQLRIVIKSAQEKAEA